MLVSDMHILFKILYDKVDSLQYPNLLPEEIDVFLNLSLDQLIEYKLGRANSKRAGLEEIQVRIDDLSDLFKTVEIPSIANPNNPNELTFPIPSDYRHFFSILPKYNSKNCGEGFSTEARQVTYESLSYYLKDPFDGPFYNQPIYLFEGDSLKLYKKDDYNIPYIKFTYLSQPLVLDINATGINSPVGYTNECSLLQYVCKQIVTWAVDAAIEDIESPRVQTFPRQLEKSQ